MQLGTGLAEMHGHLSTPLVSRELVEHILFLRVANGITTVRGMQGNPSALENRAAAASGNLLGPRVIELRREILKGLRAAGAGIILDTDSQQTFSVPGFSIHREMQAMAAAGLTAFEILKSGTRNAAICFKILSEADTVEQGKHACLLLLKGNPLQDTSNVAGRAAVVVAGRWVPNSEIQQGLEKLAAAAPNM